MRFSASLSLFVFTLHYLATTSPILAMQLPNTPQQRHSHLLSPRLRHNGGSSRVCRRFLWRKSRNTVALPVFAALHFGDNSATPANQLPNGFSLCTLYSVP